MRRLLSLLIAGTLILGCSDDATGPVDDGGGDTEEAFLVSWSLDAGRAASSTVTAAGGGTLVATDADGVSYTLEVPPGALGGDTLVTITPFASLSIEGPGLTVCEGCAPPDTLCCVRGALFEPAGLAFDTTAVLTIHYPVAVPMPPDTMGRIVLLGDDPAVYAPCSTSVDAGARTIETGISHFSGYGTDAPDCDRLTGAFIEARDRMTALEGTAMFYGAAGDFWSLRRSGIHCDGYGTCVEVCPGLADGVDSWIELSAANHGAALQSFFAGEPADWSTIDALVGHADAALRLAAACPSVGRSDLRATILGIIREKAGVIADEAWAACEDDRCDEGRSALSSLVDLADRGYIEDAAFAQLLRDRYEDCCGGWNLSLSVDNTTILRAIIQPGDETMTSATFTMTVTTASGEPVADKYVDLYWDEDRFIGGGTTDESGVARKSIGVRDLGSGDRFNCAGSVVKEVYAKIYDSSSSTNYFSDAVTITFRNFVVSATVSYTYTFDEYEDAENYGSGSASVSGGGWNYGNSAAFYICDNAFNGTLRRSYSSSGCTNGECGTNTFIDGLEYEKCLLRPNLESVLLDNGTVTYRLVSLTFNTVGVPGQAWMELCKEGECDTSLVYVSAWAPWPAVPSLWESVDGVIEPLTWSLESETENANLSIVVEAYY
ncbi:MAG: hypothetical protein JW876_04340 [Candidatus Krumholzibacteriota bacterium]|nr:hypothetical protein [Candidatus Krumholzibacteriota bacterium]